MSPRDNVWVAQRGYTPLTGCEVKGNVVLIAQWGSGGAPPAPAPAPAFSFGDIYGGFFTDDYIDTVNVAGGLFTDTYINTTNIDGGSF